MSRTIKLVSGAGVALLLTAALIALVITEKASSVGVKAKAKIEAPPGFEAIETTSGIYYRRISIDPKLPGASSRAFGSAL